MVHGISCSICGVEDDGSNAFEIRLLGVSGFPVDQGENHYVSFCKKCLQSRTFGKKFSRWLGYDAMRVL